MGFAVVLLYWCLWFCCLVLRVVLWFSLNAVCLLLAWLLVVFGFDLLLPE